MKKTIFSIILATALISCTENNKPEQRSRKISTNLDVTKLLNIQHASVSNLKSTIVELDNFDPILDLKSSTIIRLGQIDESERDDIIENDLFSVNVDIQTKVNGIYVAQLVTSQMEPISDEIVLEDGIIKFKTNSRAVIFDELFLQITNVNGVAVRREKKNVSKCVKGYYELTNEINKLPNLCQGSNVSYYIRVENEVEHVVKKTQQVKARYLDDHYRDDRHASQFRSEMMEIVYYEAKGVTRYEGFFKSSQHVLIKIGDDELHNHYREEYVNSYDIEEHSSIVVDAKEYQWPMFIGLYSIGGRDRHQMGSQFYENKFYIKKSHFGEISGQSNFGKTEYFKKIKRVRMDVYIK